MNIKERNEQAFKIMRQKFQDYLDSDSELSVREVFKFAEAHLLFNSAVIIAQEESNTVCCHLLGKVDTQEDGIGEQPRYKLITKYEWALNNCVRDWNNRLEMGK